MTEYFPPILVEEDFYLDLLPLELLEELAKFLYSCPYRVSITIDKYGLFENALMLHLEYKSLPKMTIPFIPNEMGRPYSSDVSRNVRSMVEFMRYVANGEKNNCYTYGFGYMEVSGKGLITIHGNVILEHLPLGYELTKALLRIESMSFDLRFNRYPKMIPFL